MAHDMLKGTTLRRRAARAIADEHLHTTLRTATDKFVGQRLAGISTLGNFEQLRTAARSIRAEVLADLPATLEKLADGVQAQGGKVCWAGNAEDATRYIQAIARRVNAKVVTKSKSMASEEVHLNDALQAVGAEVVETDLGEWIIQLANEPPSHIIAPAVHKTRGDVAEIFSHVDEGPASDSTADLCDFARRKLRKKFLEADIGVSGVNFGIAETGTIAIVTNEGNGRMVTSVPKIHVAIMGMERVLQTWEQFDVMLALLPRSASGQDITVYVNTITGPRRDTEVDGPDEFHLIILDNGRSDVLGTEFQEILHCIRCGACLNVCPVYRQIGGHAYGWVYSGPVGAVLTPLLARAEEAGELSDASSLCGACWKACPVGIPLQDLLLGLRRRRSGEKSLAERVMWKGWAAAWSRPASYRASVSAAATASRIMPPGLAPKAWRQGRAVPHADNHESFRSRFKKGLI